MDATNTTIDIGKRTAQYIALRDKIDTIKKRHAEELKPFNDALQQLNMLLLGYLNATNQDNASIKGVGTVYRKENVSATLADADAFRNAIIEQGAWDLADIKANKTAVRDYVDEYGYAPVGVNYSVSYDVGVRRGK